MIEFNRLCIPITDICNLNCKYCFKHDNPRDLETVNDKFYNYLENLKITNTVCLTGGETLLRFDRIQEIFSHVPDHIHKKIITNGTFLNEDYVEYFNKLDVEVCVSNDGENTILTRGVNILEDEKIVKCIKQIKNLTMSFVICAFTIDTKIISYFEEKLGRKDFVPLMNIDINSEYSVLDYLNVNNLCFLKDKRLLDTPWYKNSYSKRRLPMVLNITTKGEIWTNSAEAYICNYDVSEEEFDQAILNSHYPSFKYCKNHYDKCILKDMCKSSMNSNELYCKYSEKKYKNQLRGIYVV